MVGFTRRRGKPRGKPTGGSGGRGGSVVIQADPAVPTLLNFRYHPHHAAADGGHGQGDLRHGRTGDDLLLGVPPGTVVWDEAGTMLADLVSPGQRITLLRGGRGGRGNAAFVSPELRAPTICEQGEYGVEAWFALELKLVADAALVGFPNAGKSTLISRVSAAKPKIADYPFTTLEPNLGVVAIGERQFVLADIPGLIEGAAEGKGLGHTFLRHVERARALVVLLDPSPLQTVPPAQQLAILLGELDAYSPELLGRPRVVVVGKADLAEARLAGVDGAMVVSAVTGEGISPLLHRIADLVEQSQRETPEREGYLLHRPAGDGFTLRKEGHTWIVEGPLAVRAVRFADLTDPQAARMAARRLTSTGIDSALAKAGAQPGDVVRIGRLVFEYLPDETARPPKGAASDIADAPAVEEDR